MRSMTTNVASVSRVIIDPSTADSRLSLRLGTACKHSLDTSEKDPIVFRSHSGTLSRHNLTSREACAIVGYASHLLLIQASIRAATAPEVAQRRLASYRGIGCQSRSRYQLLLERPIVSIKTFATRHVSLGSVYGRDQVERCKLTAHCGIDASICCVSARRPDILLCGTPLANG